jgi:N-carbamoyl-L-amino-acid hydrolase
MKKTSTFKINDARLIKRLDDLSHMGAVDQGGVSRLALTNADKQARDQLVLWMKESQMAVRVDRIGNIVGIRHGETDEAPVMIGSHIDSVINAGRYDGCYGVLAAMECVHALNENNVRTYRPIAVTAFTNEEGVRYQPGMLGSGVYCGRYELPTALGIKGTDGTTLGEELKKIGYAGEMESGEIRPYAYLELHIEQGPILDQERIPLGIVDGVVGISWQEITVIGTANHAGTTPINHRRDAGLAAAKLIIKIREIAESIDGNQRATCGMINFHPNAINVIPGRAVFTVDLRNDDESSLYEAEQRIANYSRELESSENITIQLRRLENVPAVKFHPYIVAEIEKAADDLGIPFRRMISGAGHDAQLMAGICPAAMIFVPSMGGISHSPAEYTSPEELEVGANILLRSAISLAEKPGEI